MSVRATITSLLTAVETLSVNVPFVSADRNAITHNGLDRTQTLHATTTPTATKTAFFSAVMTTGEGTIDLRAVPGTETTVDLNGQKPRAILIRAKPTNANPITISKGAVDGYTGFGADFSITLQPGQRVLIEDSGVGTAVSNTVKTLDLAGTGAQGVDVGIVAGA